MWERESRLVIVCPFAVCMYVWVVCGVEAKETEYWRKFLEFKKFLAQSGKEELSRKLRRLATSAVDYPFNAIPHIPHAAILDLFRCRYAFQ